MLQAIRSRFRFPLRALDYSIDLIIPASQCVAYAVIYTVVYTLICKQLRVRVKTCEEDCTTSLFCNLDFHGCVARTVITILFCHPRAEDGKNMLVIKNTL
jgi:hypothetical protein